MIVAGIDIGTNTVLMVIARVMPDGSLDVIDDRHNIARLGQGVDATGSISNEACIRAENILREYAVACVAHGVQRIRAVATSAMRDAGNASEIRRRLSDAIGTNVEVIDGDEEARLTYIGTVGNTTEHTLVIDIGGGSTELTAGQSGVIVYSVSEDIGAVRLTERIQATRPLPTLADVLLWLQPLFSPYRERFANIANIVAVAGTPTSLAVLDMNMDTYSATHVDGHILTHDAVNSLASMIWSLDADGLRRHPGIDPRRADILPAGSSILLAIMSACNMHAVRVSIRGLRYGAALSAVQT